MSNHVAGNWFVSTFKMRNMSQKELERIANSKNYRYTTRQNAENILIDRKFDWID